MFRDEQKAMTTKRKLRCLDHIPTAEASEAWRLIHVRQEEWAQAVKKHAANEGLAHDRGRSAEDQAKMGDVKWGT
jgi:hypothetical protein